MKEHNNINSYNKAKDNSIKQFVYLRCNPKKFMNITRNLNVRIALYFNYNLNKVRKFINPHKETFAIQ